jgi:hypothetical protein
MDTDIGTYRTIPNTDIGTYRLMYMYNNHITLIATFKFLRSKYPTVPL